MPFIELHAAADARYRPANRIMTFAEWCTRNSFSKVTGWRILRRGDGPVVTEISPHRIGIREDHHAAWLETRKVRLPHRPRAKSRSKK